MGKTPTTYRLSDETLALIERLAKSLGIANKTAVVEIAVHELALARKVVKK